MKTNCTYLEKPFTCELFVATTPIKRRGRGRRKRKKILFCKALVKNSFTQ